MNLVGSKDKPPFLLLDRITIQEFPFDVLAISVFSALMTHFTHNYLKSY